VAIYSVDWLVGTPAYEVTHHMGIKNFKLELNETTTAHSIAI
jgi:hypothetical protein